MAANLNGLSDKFNANCRAIVVSLTNYLETQDWGSGVWPGSGWRTGSAEHITGRAVDIMVSGKATRSTGRRPTATELAAANKLVALLEKHAKALGIIGMIFSRDGANRPQIWGYSQPGRWRNGANRGTVSSNHIDHVHIYFGTSAKLPSGFTWGTAPTPSKPTPPSTGNSKPPAPKVPKLVSTVSVADLRTARYADPTKAGTPLGRYADQVWTLETALVKTRWVLPEHKDGHYGDKTVGDGSPGYGGTRGFQVKHSNVTKAKADGWLGERELVLLFKLAGMRVRVVAASLG